jgi:hypothetical protein
MSRKEPNEIINQLIRAAVLLAEGIIPSPPNEPPSRSTRICSHCRKLFSVKRPKEGIRELAGYRVLAAVLNQEERKDENIEQHKGTLN